MNGCFQKRIFSSVSFCLLGMLLVLAAFAGPAWSGGGTNGLLSRMETMVGQMAQSGEMSAEEAQQMRDQISELRRKVDQRIEENGGWMNPVHDKDLYGEIDRYNKPIFDRYQKSQAKKTSNPATLGYPQPPSSQQR